jgi:hypothetical protein
MRRQSVKAKQAGHDSLEGGLQLGREAEVEGAALRGASRDLVSDADNLNPWIVEFGAIPGDGEFLDA